MFGFLNLESLLNKLWPDALTLHGVCADGNKAIYFCQYLNILFPDLLVFSELLKEIADKQPHLFFDLLLHILNISN